MSCSLQSPMPSLWGVMLLAKRPPASRFGAPGVELGLLHAAQRIARRVALGAVARALGQVGAAVPGRRALGIGDELVRVEIEQLPDAHGAAGC